MVWVSLASARVASRFGPRIFDGAGRAELQDKAASGRRRGQLRFLLAGRPLSLSGRVLDADQCPNVSGVDSLARSLCQSI